jgi:hypothetical protein
MEKRAMQSKCAFKAAAIFAMLVGCSGRPAAVAFPDFDPEQIGAKAVELCDRDGDGFISAEECKESKALEAAKSRIDSNGDDKLTADEIAGRIRSYGSQGAGLAPVQCTIVKGGRPVVGATVRYAPEPFMGDVVEPASGETFNDGSAAISIAEEHLPSPRHSGMRPGFYRVSVTLANGKPVEKLDAGAECAGDVLNIHQFQLP